MTSGAVTVGAPFAGWAMPLAGVPDPVTFDERVDPTAEAMPATDPDADRS